MPVQKTRPALWIMVPVALILAATSIWGTFHYGPIGKPSQTSIECEALKEFILDEEVTGREEWSKYRDLVDQYLALAPTANRASAVEEIAFTVVKVLENDLKIYEEMEKFPSCVLRDKRQELPSVIEETKSAIGFLSGSEAINGTFFDPESGSWNPDYYNEYLSATEFLKNQQPKADV